MKRERQVIGVIVDSSRSQEHLDFLTEKMSTKQYTPSLKPLISTFALARNFVSNIQSVMRETSRAPHGARVD